MSETALATVEDRSLAKGMAAGLIGGLVATAAKSMAEKIYPPRTHGEPEPPLVLADKLAGRHLDWGEHLAAGEAIHWSFGAFAGAVYGGLAEYYPAVAAKEGASFGLALATLSHQAALPAMGLSAPPDQQTPREKTSEMGTHIVFGLVTELVRRVVRKRM